MHKLQESGEMYLETILILTNRMNYVRSIDVVEYMGYSKPSVSVAMKHFRENGYVTMDDGYFLRLTEKGSAIAEQIYERHVILAKLLMAIGVDEKTAFEDACKIEHDLSPETFERLKERYQKLLEK